jgi:type I restriction enzyme S subunit
MSKNSLPKGWELKKLGEVCSSPQYGYTTSGSQNGDVKLLRTTDITSGKIEWKRVPFCKENPKEIGKYILYDGDIVISRAGSVGVSYLLRKPEPSVFASYLIRFRPIHDIILTDYFFHFLQSPLYWNEISEKSLGIAVPNVNASKLKEIHVPIPTLTEQQAIVFKIEELLSDLDNGKQQLQTAQQQLKIYRQSLLKWAFEGKLTNADVKDGELPKSWSCVKTGDVIDIINNGYTPTKEYLSANEGEVPFIKIYNLNFDGTLNFKKNPTFIPNTIHKTALKRSICIPGDVLINIVGPPLGKISVVTKEFPEWNINQAIVMFRPNEKILSKYISYFFQNSVTTNWLEGTSKATAGQWNVKVSTCREIPIPVAPVKEQHQIVEELESKLTYCDKIAETIAQSLQQAETLRQSILKKAFEGKLL